MIAIARSRNEIAAWRPTVLIGIGNSGSSTATGEISLEEITRL